MGEKESMGKRKEEEREEIEPLTKEEFFDTLKKVTRPIGESPDQEKSETLADRRPDDCTEKHTR